MAAFMPGASPPLVTTAIVFKNPSPLTHTLRFAFKYSSVANKSLIVLEALFSQVFNIQSFLK